MSDVRILSGNIEDDDITKQVILRGVLDQNTLKYVKMAWYQRERGFSSSHINEIIAAYFSGSKVADITVGMRGQRVQTAKNDVYVLQDPCFCIDGGQRLTAAAMAVKERPDLKLSIGVKAYLGTTEEFENELFCKLGTTQVRVAASVLLRNRKKKSPAANLLVAINKNEKFALKDRIAWDQRKTRHELMFGFTFARIVGALHAHKGGALRSSKVYDLLDGLDILVENIGEENALSNVIKFFDVIDKCWTIRQLSGNGPHPHLKSNFLLTIAKLLSSYPDFWDGSIRNEFYFPEKFIKRLRGFQLMEYMSTSKPIPKDALYELLRKRLNLNPIFEEDIDEAAE